MGLLSSPPASSRPAPKQPIDLIANPTATTHTLTLPHVQLFDAGSYDCVITNACGMFTSAAAELVVCAADFNCDGAVDFFDYDAFVVAFESPC